jgi:cap2 methyltransferase
LLVEIYFLTTYGHLSRNVVYAGAAPGMHIQYLSNLFPNHNFHLYDPNEIKVKATEHVHIY